MVWENDDFDDFDDYYTRNPSIIWGYGLSVDLTGETHMTTFPNPYRLPFDRASLFFERKLRAEAKRTPSKRRAASPRKPPPPVCLTLPNGNRYLASYRQAILDLDLSPEELNALITGAAPGVRGFAPIPEPGN